MRVTVIDYGMGNIWSVLSACNYLGTTAILASEAETIYNSDCLILPGVGSFNKAIKILRSKGIDQAILEAVNQRGVNILGICLGMQILGSKGVEDGQITGLNLIPNRIKKFSLAEVGSLKIPHVGFNSVHVTEYNGLFKDMPENPDFYFVHLC